MEVSEEQLRGQALGLWEGGGQTSAIFHNKSRNTTGLLKPCLCIILRKVTNQKSERKKCKEPSA